MFGHHPEKVWGINSARPKTIDDKGQYSFERKDPAYKLIYAAPDRRTGGIEDQVVDVGHTSGKEQLNHLDNERQPRAGQKDFPKAVQTPVQNRHNDARRYKQAYVTDDVDGGFAL